MNLKVHLGRERKKKSSGNDALSTKKKKETQVLCSDKITTTDVTCLPLDVSDHTGTIYMHPNDCLAQNTGSDSVFKYCSRQSSFFLTGLTPCLREHSSFKHRLCFLRFYANHTETSLNMGFF